MMRTLYGSIYIVTAFASLASAQIDLTVYPDPNHSDSLIVRWQQPPDAVPPVVYFLFGGPTAGQHYFSETFTEPTEFHYAWSPSQQQWFFWIIAGDNEGRHYYTDYCGFQKYLAIGGAGTVSTPFGIPFVTWNVVAGVPQYGVASSDPSDIIGDQTNCGTLATADRILRQDNGEFAIRNSQSGCAWTQHLQINHNMSAPRAFWYQNKTGANRTFYIFGEGDITTPSPPVTIIGNLNGTVSTAYSWRDPRSRDRGNLQLVEQGFHGGTIGTSDRILSQVGGSFFYRRVSDGTWQGTLIGIEPGRAYWFQSFGHESYDYTYDPSGP